jgi:hypothetical protein
MGSNFTNVISTEGSNNWSVWCNDTAGNENLSSVTFYKDTINPHISVASPASTTYSLSPSVGFNVSSNETLSYCKFTLNNWLTNYTMTQLNSTFFNHTRDLTNADYTAKFWCNDTAGNINNTEEVSFTVAVGGGGGCTDDCSSGQEEKQCVNSTTLETRICGDYDTDSCAEWSQWSYVSCKADRQCINDACLSTLPNLKVEMVEPASDRDVVQNQSFEVLVRVTCENADCGEIDVALDPEKIKESPNIKQINRFFNKIYAKIKFIIRGKK